MCIASRSLTNTGQMRLPITHPMRFFLSLGLRSTTSDSEALKFRGGFKVPSECTIGCLTGRRLAILERIQRKTHLQSRATAHNTDNETTTLRNQKAYQSCCTFSSPKCFLE
jgi:hypothetical protein